MTAPGRARCARNEGEGRRAGPGTVLPVRRGLIVGLLWVVLTGCVGTVTRAEFDQEVQRRGGGFHQQQVLDLVDGVAARVGTDRFAVTHLTVSPGSDVVTLRVRNPAAPDELDDYVFRAGDLLSTEPVRLSASTDLDAQTFVLADVALDRLDQMVDDALEAFAVSDTYVTSVQVGLSARPGQESSPTVGVVVSMESPRTAGTATSTPGGELVDVRRR